MTTKKDIFDMFYQAQDTVSSKLFLCSTHTVRAGGGKIKTKMARCMVTKESQDKMLIQIKNDSELLTYYNKLLNRDSDLAPLPRPN